jgi:1-acyl-sn-glycerol-3-phosphate acyltransferase
MPLIALYTTLLGGPAIVIGLVTRGGRAVHSLAVLWGRAILWTLGVEVEITGATNVPAGPAVYASNHASALDIPILFAGMPVDFRIIHKRSLYFVPVLGLYLYVADHVGIDREHPFRAQRSLERAAGRIRGGTSVLVFPEGTRRAEAGVGLFKRGPFVLALRAGVPVVPVSLVGVKRVLPGGVVVRPGRVRVILHSALATTGRDPEQAAELAEEVRRIVATACEAA